MDPEFKKQQAEALLALLQSELVPQDVKNLISMLVYAGAPLQVQWDRRGEQIILRGSPEEMTETFRRISYSYIDHLESQGLLVKIRPGEQPS